VSAIPASACNSSSSLTGRLTKLALAYQRILTADPLNIEALIAMSLIALASGQSEAAATMATAAVSAAAEGTSLQGSAWVALGQALNAQGRSAEADAAYQQAIRLDGMNVFARVGLGELRIAEGLGEQAAREFELVILRRPSLVAAHLGLGNALALQDRNEEALECYEQALSFKPGLPEAEYASGFVLARLGRLQEAEVRYRRALTIRPDFAAAWVSLGCLLRDRGQDLWAVAALDRAVQLRPDLIAGWINLASLERERRHPEQAESHLRKAFALNPAQIETLIAWCQFRIAQKDLAGAWSWLRWARLREPSNPEATNTHGILLHAEQRFSEAIAVFDRAHALGSKSAASNRGNSLLDMGRMNEALEAHEQAVQADPNHPGARYNLALTRLRLGDWERGWQDYEARWQFREVHPHPRVFQQPRWHGEDLHGRRVLLHAEQGLGDTIQFCRYAALAAARGGQAILQVQEPVERLMHSLPAVRDGLVEVARLGAADLEAYTPYDLECPLMSSPALFRTTVETVPWPGAYLAAAPGEAREKFSLFPSTAGKLRIGLAWAGNPRYKADHLRSATLSSLLPLLRTPRCSWFSLQKGDAVRQIAALPRDVSVLDASSHDRDLTETAALVTTLDLVITTDTCIAHLAGAMAKPTWILLPHLADWRWMEQLETTPWYPTVRLFRQPTSGDWPGLANRASDELLHFSQS
jgi:tetratricopeptide (TPR) repeat protein